MNFKTSKNRKHIIKIRKKTTTLVFILAIFLVNTIIAQRTPEPPTPPQTTSKSSSSYSISVDNDSNEKHNSSVSISVSDDSYKFRASFHNS
jgi:hypothetical protein